MKNILNLFIAHLRRISKNTSILTYFIGMPVFMFGLVFIINIINNNNDKEKKEQKSKIRYSVNMENIGIVVNDKGELWKDFFKDGDRFILEKDGLEQAKKQLEKIKLIGIVVVDSNFSKDLEQGIKPKLRFIQMIKGNTFQNKINIINKNINAFLIDSFSKSGKLNLSKQAIEKENIKIKIIKDDMSLVSFGLKMFTLMILYIIIFGSCAIATELVRFRETRMLTRAIASPNSEFAIIISLLFSFIILQVFINFTLFLIFTQIFTIEVSGLGSIFITVFSTSAFSLSLAIVLVRIFNKVEQLPIVTTILSIITVIFFVLSAASIMDGLIDFPPILKKLAILSPLYWLIDILDKGKFFPNIIVVWLMIIALITAGSWRLRDFNRAN